MARIFVTAPLPPIATERLSRLFDWRSSPATVAATEETLARGLVGCAGLVSTPGDPITREVMSPRPGSRGLKVLPARLGVVEPGLILNAAAGRANARRFVSFRIVLLPSHETCAAPRIAEQGHAAEDRPGVELRAPADASRADVMLVVEVDDAHREHTRLTERGVRMLAELYEPPWGGCRFFCVDPDGYLVELEEPA